MLDGDAGEVIVDAGSESSSIRPWRKGDSPRVSLALAGFAVFAARIERGFVAALKCKVVRSLDSP